MAVVGAGYVGLTTAVGLAHRGHHVACIDNDPDKIQRLRHNQLDLVEPDLPDLVAHHHNQGHLTFHTRLDQVIPTANTVIMCLPTPGSPDGTLDLSALDEVTHQLHSLLRPGNRVVLKSTVPPGTHRRLATLLDRDDITLISNPEFLREGSALHDFLHPQRVVIGTHHEPAAHSLTRLYGTTNVPVLVTDPTSAELIKYAANSYLALKLTYSNTLAELCEHLDGNIIDVLNGLGHDPRIGTDYLQPGPGWGGPCLPKDTRALLATGTAAGCNLALLQTVLASNTHHQQRIATLVETALDRPLSGAHIAILGLTFKAGTNDLRDSPALPVTRELAARGACLYAYDPALPGPLTGHTDHLTLTARALDALTGCDLALLLTDWPEFATLPWTTIASHMHGHVIVDTRNQLTPNTLAHAGLTVRSLGTGATHRHDCCPDGVHRHDEAAEQHTVATTSAKARGSCAWTSKSGSNHVTQ